ncbi:MAG: STM4012 family radical SAM protein [Gracilibacteraceae bacterium]|nr:STM4012 family radical SAM protein [Gracilibacteraceae bacterium]
MKIALPEISQRYMYSYPHKTAYGPLRGINVFDHLVSCDLNRLEIYFHIPFCTSKCGYCNLFSITGQPGETLDRYLGAMEQQIAQYGLASQTLKQRTVAIGGGTPLILSETQLDRLLRLLPGMNQAHSSIETSPNETTKTKLAILKAYSINRVSLGVQSFIDRELTALKRQHPARAAYHALDLLKAHDFPTLNLDLIYGIPSQTLSSLQTSLEEGLKFAPDEFFIYPLYIRKGTSLADTRHASDQHPTPCLLHDMYWLARDLLTNAGYTQLSMRRFVKHPSPAPTSCGFEPMLAIGCGGRSYLGDLHFCHPFVLSPSARQQIIMAYIDTPDKTRITHGYLLNQNEHKRRFLIKNLLHIHGISLAEYQKVFQTDLPHDFPILHEWAQQGFTQTIDNHIRLTPLGLSLSDSIGPKLISPAVRRRMGGHL